MNKKLFWWGVVLPVSTAAVVVLVVLLFGVVRNALIEDNEALAQSVAQSILPALLVNDTEQVASLMKALESYPGIEVAELISADGAPIASYAKSDKAFHPMSSAFELASSAEDSNQIHVSSPITFDSLIVANLHIAVNLWPIYMRIISWLGLLLILPSVAYVLVKQFRIKLRFERVSPSHSEDDGSGGNSFDMANAIKDAMNEADISIEFQPIHRMSDAGLFGMEVVVCWRHPSGQTLYVQPSDFLELAEKSGISIPFDSWLLTTSCSLASKWQHQYGPLVMTVGITSKQFSDSQFAQSLRNICEQAQYPHQLLELAIFESAVVEHGQKSHLAMQSFATHGLSVVLDKFGLTNRSHELLDMLPIRKVRLDARLVRRLNCDEAVTRLTQLLIDQSVARGVQVSAAEIQTAEQHLQLCNMGCLLGQGVYCGNPMTASAFSEFLSKYSFDISQAHRQIINGSSNRDYGWSVAR